MKSIRNRLGGKTLCELVEELRDQSVLRIRATRPISAELQSDRPISAQAFLTSLVWRPWSKRDLLLPNAAGVERLSPGVGVMKPGMVLANSSNTAVWFGVTPPTWGKNKKNIVGWRHYIQAGGCFWVSPFAKHIKVATPGLKITAACQIFD